MLKILCSMSHEELHKTLLGYTEKIDGVLSYFDRIYSQALHDDEPALIEYAGVMKYVLSALQELKKAVRAGDRISLMLVLPKSAFIEGEVKRLKFALVLSNVDY